MNYQNHSMDDYHHDDAQAGSFDLRPIQPPELDVILSEHQHWLDSGGREGRRANLRGADLHQVSFAGKNLSSASLRGSDLAGVNFSGANLHEADLAEANLSDANFQSANLTAAILTHVTGSFANFTQADMQQANLSAAKLDRALFDHTNLSQANLREAVLTQPDFTHANLHGAAMRGASLHDAQFHQADLSQADCRDVDFTGAALDQVNVTDAQLRGAQLLQASVKAVDFTTAIEVPQEYLNFAHIGERKKLEEEQERLRKAQATLEIMQKGFEEERLAHVQEKLKLEEQGRQQQALGEMVLRHKKRFTLMASLWGALTIGFVVMTIIVALKIDAQSLNVVEIGVMFAVFALVLLLFISAMIFTTQLARTLQATGQGRPVEPRRPIPTHGPRRDSAGFGKR